MALNRFSFISFELFSLAKIYFDVAVRFNFLATKEENHDLATNLVHLRVFVP
jgi:hypothetical protein